MSAWRRRADKAAPERGATGDGRARPTPMPSRVSNAAPQVIVDYGVDQVGYDQAQAINLQAFGRLSGHGGGAAYVGEKGDVGNGLVYTGRGPELQHFAGAAALASNPVTYRETQPTIDNGTAEGDYADPARRIFAQRLARRR